MLMPEASWSEVNALQKQCAVNQESSGVTELSAVKDSYVPVIKFKVSNVPACATA